MSDAQSVFSVQNLDFYYGPSKALSNIGLEIEPRKVTALIGPSGCGKSTFLRCLNRMNDTISGTRMEGRILLDGKDIYDEVMDVVTLRQRVGMGICGEHGGDPSSVYFFHRAGLNYVSASPYRVPVARLAAAQVALEEKGLAGEAGKQV